MREQFLQALTSEEPDIVSSTWLLDRVPVPFAGDLDAYARWRHTLAADMLVDPSSLKVIGSAACGISFNPHKNFRPFDEKSDIDVAVVSDFHFTSAWRALRSFGARVYGMPPATKNAIKEHEQRLIYWGTIATDKFLHLLPFGESWSKALDAAANRAPTVNRKLKCRIYRDAESLRAYHVANFQKLRDQRLAAEVTDND